MVRFLDSAKERAKILLDEINKHPKSLGNTIGGYSVSSACFDRNSLSMQVDFAKLLCSIEENGLRYSNNEEFLNYLSSEFFKGITFKIKYDKNGIEKDIVPSLNFKEALSNGDILSDATYTYKELVDKIIIKNEFNRNLSQTNLSLLPLTIFDSKNYNHIPSGQKLTEYYLMVCNAAVDKAKAANDELKNSAIKAYNNKQILKSAGIGALVAGAVALCAALICRKDKEKE